MIKMLFNWLTLSLVSSLPWVLAGCGANNSVLEVAAEKGTAVPEEAPVNLENTDWILVELNGKTVETAAPLKTPSLRFDGETGLATGNSGVNQFGGSYTLTDDSVEFGPMHSTMMAGPPEAMAMEQAFLAVLSGMTGWRITESRLELLAADTVIARFAVAPSAPVAVVSGTVFYREKMMLRPGSVLEVTLEDVSKADAKAEVIATFRKENPGNPPFAFELEYDPARIDPRFTYSVRARITRNGEPIFVSDTMVPVITRGQGNAVEILIKGVGTAQ